MTFTTAKLAVLAAAALATAGCSMSVSTDPDPTWPAPSPPATGAPGPAATPSVTAPAGDIALPALGAPWQQVDVPADVTWTLYGADATTLTMWSAPAADQQAACAAYADALAAYADAANIATADSWDAEGIQLAAADRGELVDECLNDGNNADGTVVLPDGTVTSVVISGNGDSMFEGTVFSCDVSDTSNSCWGVGDGLGDDVIVAQFGRTEPGAATPSASP